MNKKHMIISVITMTLMFASCKYSLSTDTTPGVDRNSKLQYLKSHFSELYDEDYKQFCDLLNQARLDATECKTIQDTVAFLELAPYAGHNSELSEYFAEAIAIICVENTQCFLDAVTLTDKDTQDVIIFLLNHPIEVDQEEVDEALYKYKSKDRYKEFIIIYENSKD